MRVLVADPIAEEGIVKIREVAEVDVCTGLSREELLARIGQYDALVVRSETQVTEEVIAAGTSLKVIARAGVGVDNIDVAAATRRGILVVNSPEANTIAAAEHTWALLLALARKIPMAHSSLQRGEWKRNQFIGVELYGKILGIIGLGKIGREVAKRARGFEMQILAYDPFIPQEQAERLGVRLVELDELLAVSDFITIHIPLTRDTRGLLNYRRLALCKPHAFLINCARGGIVVEEDLVRLLEEGMLAGAALDVFEREPIDPNHPLLRSDKVVLTPHLGASTREAQIGVALDIAEQVCDVLQGRPPRSAVNMPFISPELMSLIEPFLRLAEKIGHFQAQITEGRIYGVEVMYSGQLAEYDVAPITRALLKGLLEPILSQGVTYVNAPLLTEQRGIKVTESKTQLCEDYTNLITVTVRSDKMTNTVSGTLFGKRDIRIVAIDGFRVDVEPEGYALISRHIDRPGIIGRVGTLLGQANINIAGMHVGRAGIGKEAVMILNVDDPVPESLLKQIAQMEGIYNARLIEF